MLRFLLPAEKRCGLPAVLCLNAVIYLPFAGKCDFCQDWWALGVLIYELMTGTPPFNNPNGKDVCLTGVLASCCHVVGEGRMGLGCRSVESASPIDGVGRKVFRSARFGVSPHGPSYSLLAKVHRISFLRQIRLSLVQNSQEHIIRRIRRKEPKYPSWFSAELVALLKGLLCKDADRRLGSGDSDGEVCVW